LVCLAVPKLLLKCVRVYIDVSVIDDTQIERSEQGNKLSECKDKEIKLLFGITSIIRGLQLYS